MLLMVLLTPPPPTQAPDWHFPTPHSALVLPQLWDGVKDESEARNLDGGNLIEVLSSTYTPLLEQQLPHAPPHFKPKNRAPQRPSNV